MISQLSDLVSLRGLVERTNHVWIQAFTTRFLLYFHSKGDPWGKHLLDTVIKPWKKVVTIFHKNPGIDKIGYSYSPEGFIWYNFWRVRSMYARRLEEPVMTPDRYYYEQYLALLPRRKGGDLSFSKDNYVLDPTNCKGLKVSKPWTNS